MQRGAQGSSLGGGLQTFENIEIVDARSVRKCTRLLYTQLVAVRSWLDSAPPFKPGCPI